MVVGWAIICGTASCGAVSPAEVPALTALSPNLRTTTTKPYPEVRTILYLLFYNIVLSQMVEVEMSEKFNGYKKLASLMGQNPEVAIFRRFNTLNARNLLYLQAELVDLEKRLEEASKLDEESFNSDRQIYDRHWANLSESVSTPDGNSEQWTLALKIRGKVEGIQLVYTHPHSQFIYHTPAIIP
jgi:hypothetical protein